MFHHVDELSVALPLSLLAFAARVLADDSSVDDGVEVATVARSRFSVLTEGGLALTPTWAFAGAPEFDALIVPGGSGVGRARRDAALRSFFATRVSTIGTVVSIGAGALILGEAGLLRNRRVSAPGSLHERLEDYEIVDAVSEGLVRSDGVWTGARPIDGVAAAHALLEANLGADVEERIASAWDGPSTG